jgi:Cu-Zn family superoxide dismutase
MRRRAYRIGAVLAAVLAVAIGPLASGVRAGEDQARAVLRNGSGVPVGEVKLTQDGGTVLVRAVVHDLGAGFHGFHIHAIGDCSGAGFSTAGGHYGANPGVTDHPSHPGDLPVLLVNGDGTGEARFKTDRFTIASVLGRAFIVHAQPDNYGNVPTAIGQGGATTTAQLYVPNSTGTANTTATGLTANTGNAGARIACGVIQPAD